MESRAIARYVRVSPRKARLVARALNVNAEAVARGPVETLAALGGFEIAVMAGAIRRMTEAAAIHAGLPGWGEPLLALGLRLGEGTGAALAWPLVKSAAAICNEMATMSSAGVSAKEEDRLA